MVCLIFEFFERVSANLVGIVDFSYAYEFVYREIDASWLFALSQTKYHAQSTTSEHIPSK